MSFQCHCGWFVSDTTIEILVNGLGDERLGDAYGTCKRHGLVLLGVESGAYDWDLWQHPDEAVADA